MKKYLNLLPLLAVLAFVASCGKPDHRRTTHHPHHVHRHVALVPYYDANQGLYYACDTSTSTWYSYSIPGPLGTQAAPASANQPVTVTAVAPAPQVAPAAAPVTMSAPGASWGAATTAAQVNPSAVNAADNAMGDKAAMTGSIQTIPAGGAWTKCEPPEPDELTAEEGTVSITTNPAGEPETEEAVEAENSADEAADAADAASDSSSDGGGSDGGDGGGGD